MVWAMASGSCTFGGATRGGIRAHGLRPAETRLRRSPAASADPPRENRATSPCTAVCCATVMLSSLTSAAHADLRRARGWLSGVLLPLLILSLTACPRPAAKEASGETLVVFAAASLREPFTELTRGFEAANPGVRVRLQFAGSQQLRMQLEHGARADVFASADLRHMELLQSAGRVEQGERFARNEPVVAVALHAAEKVTDFESLPDAERIVLGVPEVPIGRYSGQILKNAGEAFERQVRSRVVSEELNVRQVLHKVILGEADAAIVYRSDLQTVQGQLKAVEIPAEMNVVADYPIGVMKDAHAPELARRWVRWVRSEEGARTLDQAGFLGLPEAVAQP